MGEFIISIPEVHYTKRKTKKKSKNYFNPVFSFTVLLFCILFI